MESIGIYFFALLGLCAGSFLNVAVLRFGYTERSAARSHCAACYHTLGFTDLIPVFSYLFLKGRCRHCGSAISAQYPLVELTVAALWGLTYALYPPDPSLLSVGMFLAALGFWTAFVGLVTYDLRHTLIPMQFVYMLGTFALVGTAVRAYGMLSYVPLVDSFAGAVIVGGFFALVHFLTRGRGMGIGDAYVGICMGLMFGAWGAVVAATFGIWIGAVWGLSVLFLSKHVTLSTELPFAPFLFLGALIVFVHPIPFLAPDLVSSFMP